MKGRIFKQVILGWGVEMGQVEALKYLGKKNINNKRKNRP